jgi:RNA polymerase-interacting CarD/CdnL/TRCF family regulator
MRFKKGDRVAYPLIGQGEIIEVSQKVFDGEKKLFYKVRMYRREAQMIVYIPVDSSKKIGLRRVMKREDIPEIMKILRELPSEIDLDKTASERYEKQIQILRAGSVYGLAQVVSTLHDCFQVGLLKPGSEKQLYEMSTEELAKELAVASRIELEEAKEIIQKALSDREEVTS